MALDRRDFIHLTAAGVLARTPLSRIATSAAESARYKGYKAVAFDAFPIFDPRPVAALGESLFPGRGAELSNAWRTRQFEYQWLRALGGQYADFWETTESALVFAAKQLRLVLTSENRAQLMQAYLRLEAWPDVRPALDILRNAGLRLALLSNMTATMLNTGISNAGLEGMFEHALSTDRIRTYKPDPRAYRLGSTRSTFGVRKWYLRHSPVGTLQVRSGMVTRLSGSTASIRRQKSSEPLPMRPVET